VPPDTDFHEAQNKKKFRIRDTKVKGEKKYGKVRGRIFDSYR
jgi:hypothetical protein